MNRLLSRIKAFILKDGSNETETKELAVLLRLLCVFYVLFFDKTKGNEEQER